MRAVEFWHVAYDTKIPNNIGLSSDRRVLKALEQWHPGYLDWWKTMGPEGFQDVPVYLRTAVSVDTDGWAKFDYVKMPDYRWGIFLTPPEHDHKVGFGDNMGQDAWQEVPGEYRNMLRRIIVTQGDTEPASVEQQRLLSACMPSMYDCRNLFQVNVEEGRHLWAMVYLLHAHFGRDGREEAEELLEKAYGALPAPSLALWSGRALEKNGKLVEASERYLEGTRAKLEAGGDQSVQEKAQAEAKAEKEEIEV